jgi:transposase
MLPVSPRRIFLATDPVDMRKSFDTLAFLIQSTFGHDPCQGDAFVFIGKRLNRLKVLLWEDSGFWLLCKRLEKGTFKDPFQRKDKPLLAMTSSEWYLFLDGILVLEKRNLSRYTRASQLT